LSYRDDNKPKSNKARLVRTGFMMFGFGTIFLFLFSSLTGSDENKVSEKLCNQTMDMMGNEYHTAMHENYPETMVQLHKIIDICHAKGYFPDDGANDNIMMPELKVK